MLSLKALLFLNLASLAGCLSDSVNFVPVGCYRDNQLEPRPLPELIHNYRLNNEMDWHDLNSTVIEACARETRDKNYLYFGIQFYGECWSGPQAHETYWRDSSSSSCINGVGESFANMVYKLTGEENECSNHKTWKTEDRSALYDKGKNDKCDRDIEGFKEGWYRFQGQAGTLMNSLGLKKRCQTVKVGRYEGPIPNVTQGILTGKACFTENCENYESKPVKIRNCGGFYVYYLKQAPGCPYRYCGNGTKPSNIIEANI